MTSSITSIDGRALLDLAEHDLARSTPLQILRALHASFGERAAILSSMQRPGTVLCHMADRAALSFEVIFVDTGVLHPETLETRQRLIDTHPHLRVRTLHPELSFEEQTRREGVLYLSKEGQERCCDLRKSAPMRALAPEVAAAARGEAGLQVLIGALRREEGGRRAQVRFVSHDPELGVLRIQPFALTPRRELTEYIAAHPDVVDHPLHHLGFPTIGCFPCTTPVRPDEEERAGRWRHLADVAYCGINPTDRGKSAGAGVDEEAPLGDRMVEGIAALREALASMDKGR